MKKILQGLLYFFFYCISVPSYNLGGHVYAAPTDSGNAKAPLPALKLPGEPEKPIIAKKPVRQAPNLGQRETPASANSSITDFYIHIDEVLDRAKVTMVWKEASKASFFTYRDKIYVVFNAQASLNLDQFPVKYFKSIQVLPHPTATILKIEMQGSYDLLLNHIDESWIFLAGEMKSETPPYTYRVDFKHDEKGLKRTLMLDDDPVVIDFKDPVTHDRFIALLDFSRGTTQAFSTPLFKTIPSYKGMTLIPLSPELAYKVDRQNLQLIFYHQNGIPFSSPIEHVSSDRVPSPVNTLVDLTSYDLDPNHAFMAGRDLQFDIAMASLPQEILSKQIELAKYYLAHAYFHEAFGILQLINQRAPEAFRHHLDLNLMLDLSHVLAHRIDSDDLRASDYVYAGEPETKVIKALLDFAYGRHTSALRYFIQGLNFLQQLPRHIRNTVALKAFEASVYSHFTQPIFKNLIDTRYLSASELDLYHFLDTRFKELTNVSFNADAVYQNLALSHNPRVQVLARLAMIDVSNSNNEARLQDLESLRFYWRGDALEMIYLNTLAELYIHAGQVTKALECYRTINSFLWHLETSQFYIKKAEDLFYETFIQNNTQPALEQLGFYFAFMDIAPQDKRYVEIMNYLVGLYQEMGLVDEALETLAKVQAKLQRQVDAKTLAKSKFIKMKNQLLKNTALIYLQKHALDSALKVVEQIDMSLASFDDPKKFRNSINFMKALIFAEQQHYDQALKLIQNKTTSRANRLRVNIYMAQERWQDAKKLLEAMIEAGKFEKFEQPADIDLILDLAVIANHMQDIAYLDTLKDAYGNKIASAEKKQIFDILTNTAESFQMTKTALINQIESADNYTKLLDSIKTDILEAPWETPFNTLNKSLLPQPAPPIFPSNLKKTVDAANGDGDKDDTPTVP